MKTTRTAMDVRRDRPTDGARRRGSVLIMVVTVIVIMALLGATYLQSVRVQRVAMSQAGGESYIDEVAGSVIQQIGTLLKADLEPSLLDPDDPTSQTLELYDYPWTNPDVTSPIEMIFTSGEQDAIGGIRDDRWLASTAPQFDASGNLTWPKITNLRGYFVGGNNGFADLDDDTNGISSEPDSDNEFVVNANNSSGADDKNADTNIDDEDILVDADGDGIGDSRWTWAPLAQVDGKMFVAAVRIVDLSSLLNVNVSPVDTLASADLRWQTPVDLNFGFLGGDAADKSAHYADASNRYEFWENTASFYAPEGNEPAILDLYLTNDEYELRNRNGLNYAENESPIEATASAYRSILRQSGTDEEDNETRYDDVSGVTDGDEEAFFFGRSTTNTGQFLDVRKWLTTMSGSSVFAMPWTSPSDFDPGFGGGLSTSSPGDDLKVDVNKALEIAADTSKTSTERRNALATVRTRIVDVLNAAENFNVPGGFSDVEDFASAYIANFLDYADSDEDTDSRKVVAYSDPDSGDVFIGMEAVPAITEVYRQREYVPQWEEVDTNPGFWIAKFKQEEASGSDIETGYAIEIRNPFPVPVRLDQIHILFGDESPTNSNLLSSTSWLGQDTLEAGETAVIYHDPPDTDHSIASLWNSSDVDVESSDRGSITVFDPEPPQGTADPALEVKLAVKLDDLTDTGTDLGSEPVIVYQQVDLTHMGQDVLIMSNVDSDEYPVSEYGDEGSPVAGESAGNPPADPSNWPDERFYTQRTHIGLTNGIDPLLTTATEFQSWTQATTNPTTTYHDTGYDALGLEDKGTEVSVAAWPTAGRIAGNPGLPEDQIILANHNNTDGTYENQLDQIGELAYVSTLGPRYAGGVDDDTIADVWKDIQDNHSGTDSVDDFRLDFTVNSSSNLMSSTDENLRVSPASFLLDQFTTLHPGLDSKNQNGDVDDVETDELMVTGQINVNTAPYELLRTVLPLPQSDTTFSTPDEPTGSATQNLRDHIAWAIVKYRDDPAGSRASGMRGTTPESLIPGIAYIGELFDVQSGNELGDRIWDENLLLGDGDTQTLAGVILDRIGNPNDSTPDGIIDDREEQLMIPRLLSNLLTVRSDTYVAYIYIQGYTAGDFSAGPVESGRFVVVFRRGVDADGEVFVKAYLPGGQIYETR